MSFKRTRKISKYKNITTYKLSKDISKIIQKMSVWENLPYNTWRQNLNLGIFKVKAPGHTENFSTRKNTLFLYMDFPENKRAY